MKDKIIKEFLASGIKIKSKEKLIEYVDFCIDNNRRYLKYETAGHHILPKAKDCFPQFKNLNLNPWNKTTLSHSNHYLAHYILLDAIDVYSQLSAFISMNNQNNAISWLDITDVLIQAEDYKRLTSKRDRKHNLIMNEEFELDGNMTTKYKEAGKKQSKTKNIKFELDGNITTIGKEAGKKSQETRSQQFIDENGLITSINEKNTIKRLKTMSEEYFDENGNVTSKNKIRNIKISDTKNLEIIIDGEITTSSKLGTAKRLETMSKSFILDGEETTIYKEAGKKQSKTLQNNPDIINKRTEIYKETMDEEILDENGNITTRNKMKAIKASETKIKNGRHFNIFHIDKGIIEDNVTLKYVKSITNSLLNTRKDRYLGIDAKSLKWLKKYNNTHLVGYYIEEI